MNSFEIKWQLLAQQLVHLFIKGYFFNIFCGVIRGMDGHLGVYRPCHTRGNNLYY